MKKIHRTFSLVGKALLIFTLLLAARPVISQDPGWTINAPSYANSGNVTARVLLDGFEVDTGKVAAFVGSEIRGVIEDPQFFGPSGYWIFSFLVYSNVSSGETMTFKYYNPLDGTVYDILETVEFTSDMIRGSAFVPLEFNAISNDPPTVDFPIANQTYNEYFISSNINLSSVFSDPDLDALTYSATSSSGGVVTVSVSGSTLTIIEEGLGSSTITVTADDGLATVEDQFTVTVNNVNDAPVVANPIADISPNEGFGSTTINLSATFSDKDNDALTLSVISADPSVVTVGITGTTLTITEVAPGTSLITVTATDGTLSVDETFTVNVNNVNDAPVVSSAIADRNLDEYFVSTTIDLTTVFTDPDGDALTLTPVSSNPTVVTAGITGNTLTLTEVGLGNSTITITASDGSLSVQDQFTVTVNNVNDAPVISNAIPNQSYNEYFVSDDINLSGRYTDKDNDPLTLTAVSGSPGVVTVGIVGNTLTITEVGLGSSSITVTVSDGTLSVDDVFTVTVNNVNDAPVVANAIVDQVLNEHFTSTTIDLTNVFFDKDGTPLTLTPSSSNPSVVTVGISGNTLTITEVGIGTSTITIAASDGSASVSDVFTVTVNNVNDAPVVSNAIADQVLDEHFISRNISLSTTFADPDGDGLTITAVSSNTAAVDVSVSGTTLTLTEVGLGSSVITVTATDGTLSVDDQFNVTVNNVNDQPVVASAIPDQTLDEGFGTRTIDISGVFTDPDADPLTLSAVSSNNGVVTVTISGSNLVITEVGLGNATVTVTATDGGLSVNDQFSVTVNNVNDTPELVSPISDRNVSEGFSTISINLTTVFSDPDGDALTYSAVSSNNAVVTVSVSSATLTITEVGLGFSDITVTAQDAALSASDLFRVTVNNVNDAPVVASAIPNQSEDEGFGTLTINLVPVFSDADGDDLTYTVASSNGTIVTASVSGTDLIVTEQGLGSATVTVTASDGSLSVNDVFTVTVNNVNDAPVVTSPITDRNLNEYFGSTSISLAGVFTDPDGDGMTYTVVSSNTGVVTVSVSGTTLTLNEQGLGSSTITVTASDGTLTAVDAFTVTVNNVNDAPVVDNAIADQELDEYFGTTSLNLSATFSDPDGDDLVLTAVSSNISVVTVSMLGTTLTINEQGPGSATITVTATDNGTGNLTGSDQFVVNVNNVNDAPVVATPISNRTYNEYFSSATIGLAGVFSDPDGDALALSAVSSDVGVVSVSVTGNTLYVTETGLGTSTITVTATDNGVPVLSVNETFDITVNNVNDAPVVANPVSNQSVNEGFGSTTLNLSNVFSDKDNDPLTITAGSSNTGIVTVSVTGTTLTITEQGNGISTITITASDASLSVSDQFSVTVNNVNDAPVIVNAITDRSYDEGFGSASISLGPVFSDPDGDVLIYSAVSSNTGVVTVGISGTTLTLTERGLGSATILVTATDGILNVSDNFEVVVNNVNDAPVVDNPVPDQSLPEYFATHVIDLSSVFSDQDVGDALTITAVSSNVNVVTTSVTGTTLTLTEAGLGSATVTLTATDNGAGNLSTNDQFNVQVYNVNDAPQVANAIADRSYNEYFGTATIDISTVFTDKDGDGLTYTVTSSNIAAATAGLVGTTLTITEQGLGSTNVTVTASDGALTVSDLFSVTVNNVNDAPVVANALADRAYDEGFTSTTISLASVFSDKDGDDLTLTATSSNIGVVTVGVSGTTLTISESGLGSSTITVSASDGTLSVSDAFVVTVNNVNDAPVVDNPITNRILNEYFGSASVNLSAVFSDPDAGDVLTLGAASSDPGVVTVSVAGTTLTITEQGLGTATITVTATDNGDGTLSVSDQFDVTVNNVNDAPVVDNPISNQSLDEYFGTFNINLSNVFSDKDLDALTLSAVSSNAAVAGVSVSGNTLTITEAGLGTATVTVTASDGTLSVDDQFTVLVNNVNDAPALDNPIANQVRDEYFASATIDLSAVFSDKDGDVILLTAGTSDAGIVTVSISGTNLIVQETGLGTATITVTASDGTLSTSDQFTFTVNNVNDAPVVIAPLGSISDNEGFGSRTINLGPVFQDPDGDAMTYSAVSSNNSVVTVSVSGTTLTITEVGLGSSTITVTATDGTLSTDDQFTFAIDNVNDAPEVVQAIGDRDYFEGFGTTSINLASIFSDPDGDVLSYTVTSGNTAVATVGISGSSLVITEQGLGFTVITVTATDGILSTDDVFMATVNNVNDGPVLDNPVPNQAYNEYFTSATVNLSNVFSDADNDPLTLTAVSSNTGVVTVGISGTTLTITEAGLGTSTITVIASDGFLTASDQFTVVVNNVNDSPEILTPLPDRTYQEGFVSAGISLAATFTDKDGDVLDLTAVSSNTGVVTVSISGTTLTLVETGLGNSVITVTASDGTLDVVDQFNVNVNNVNDPPVVDNPLSDRVLNEHFGSVDINLASVFSDPDTGDQLTLSVSNSANSVVTVALTGATLTITEAGLGTSTVTVTATDDGDGTLSVSDQFTVTVNNVNDQPEVENPVADRNLDEYFGTVSIDLSAVFSDPDDDVLDLSVVSSAPGIVAVSLSGTTLTLTEAGIGTATITVTASDGFLSVDDQFVVTVANVNDAPVVDNAIPNQVLDEYFVSTTIQLAAVFSDKDGDDLALSAVSSNSGVVTVGISGTTLTLTEAGLGNATITVTASDGSLTVQDVFTVMVNNVNDRPTVVSPVADRTVNEYFGSFTVNLAPVFNDKDGDDLTFTAVSNDAAVVTVAVSGTTLTVTERGLGLAAITVTASDGTLNITDVFTVRVNNVNDAPVVVAAIPDQSVNEYFGSSTINLSGVFDDKDEDGLTLSAVSSNMSVVTVNISGTTLTLTEQGLGSAVITVTASDGSLAVDDQFNVVVNNVNDAPVVANAISDKVYTEYDGPFTIDLSGVFTDKDADALDLTASSGNEAVVTVSVSGTTLTITEVAPGNALVTVTADDGLLTVNDQFNVTLTNVNDAPEVIDPVGNLSLSEYFATEDIDISGVFSDKDGDALTYSAISSNTGVVTVAVAGTIMTLTEVGMGTSTITLTASDGALSADDVFVVSVDNVNDNPVVDRLIPDVVEDEYFGTLTIDLRGVFSDPDVGDLLTLTATSSATDVVAVSIVDTSVVVTEAGLGTSTITVTITDEGGLHVSTAFDFTVRNVNDAPVVAKPIADQELVDNIGAVSFGLDSIFADKDGDVLEYSVVLGDPAVVSYTLEGGELTLAALEAGTTEVVVTAQDAALSAVDTFMVTVVEEVLLIVKHDGRRMQVGDTLLVCNDAGNKIVEVVSSVDWNFRKLSQASWLVVSVRQDSTIEIAFSQNLSGEDRLGEIQVYDTQGHTFTFKVRQTQDCVPDGVADAFSSGLNMYPNPVEHVLYITHDNGMLNDAQLEIIDSNGKLLYLQEIEAGAGRAIEVDMSGYSEGLYFVRIRSGEGIWMDKIVKL